MLKIILSKLKYAHREVHKLRSWGIDRDAKEPRIDICLIWYWAGYINAHRNLAEELLPRKPLRKLKCIQTGMYNF